MDNNFWGVRKVNGKYALTVDGELSKSDAKAKRSRLNAELGTSGLGIGGLGSHTEQAPAPTAEMIGRVEQMEREAMVCRSCGSSELSGAMFTTMASSGICDDCF